MSLAPADDASAIIASWNRLLAEWLPKSTFTLGEHSFIEEWMHYKGRVTRLKLFLPVERAKSSHQSRLWSLLRYRYVSFVPMAFIVKHWRMNSLLHGSQNKKSASKMSSLSSSSCSQTTVYCPQVTSIGTRWGSRFLRLALACWVMRKQ